MEIVYIRAMVQGELPSGQKLVKLAANNTDGIRPFYADEKDIFFNHGERNIVEGCIELMNDLYEKMLEYMDYLGYEFELDDYELPVFNYSYFEIVQKLLLYHTPHAGGTSTRAKCAGLGFDYSEYVTFRPDQQEDEE